MKLSKFRSKPTVQSIKECNWDILMLVFLTVGIMDTNTNSTIMQLITSYFNADSSLISPFIIPLSVGTFLLNTFPVLSL